MSDALIAAARHSSSTRRRVVKKKYREKNEVDICYSLLQQRKAGMNLSLSRYSKAQDTVLVGNLAAHTSFNKHHQTLAKYFDVLCRNLL